MITPSANITTLQSPVNPLPECPDTPNCARTSKTFSADSATILNIADQVLRDMGAESVGWQPEPKQIHAVFRIPVFGWKDDVNIAVIQEGTTTTLFIRSASREGYSDLGVNNRRVKKFFRLFNKKLSN